MKKRLLSSLLAIFLAGLGLGGVSMAATSLPCSSDAAVACIGDVGYTTVALAISNVGNGETITLIDNTTETEFTVAANKNFTLDLNGKNLTLNNNTASCLGGFIGDTCYDYVDGNLTILDSVGNGKVIIRDAGIMPRAGGTLTIENGIFDTQTYSKDYMFYLGGGTLYIIDGTFNGYYNTVNCYADGDLALGGTVVIDSGTFITTEDDGWNTTIMGYENSNITINGGKFTMSSNNGEYAFYVGIGTLTGGVEADSAVAIINGGEFNGEVLAEDGAELTIEGGVFSEDPSAFLEDGYTAVKEGGKWVIVGPVAAIDEHKYSTVTGAISAATAGQTVEILKSGEYTLPDVSTAITIKGAVEGAVFTHSVSNSSNGKIAEVKGGTNFENVSFVLKGVKGQDYKHYIESDGKISLKDCIIDGTLYVDSEMEFEDCNFVKNSASGENSNAYNVQVYNTAAFTNVIFTNEYGRNVNLWDKGDNTVRHTVSFNGVNFKNTSSTDSSKLPVMIHEARDYPKVSQWDVSFSNCNVDGIYNTTQFISDGSLFGIDDILTSGGKQEDPTRTAVSSGTENGGDIVVKVDGATKYTTPKAGQSQRTVTFDGTNTGVVNNGDKVEKPADPADQSCKSFVEWQLNGVAYDFNSVVTGNLTLISKWRSTCGGGGSSSSSSSNKTGNNNTGATVESGTTADTGANTPTVDPQGVAANGYTNEMNEAYEFAYANGITTKESIDEAEMLDGLTRIAMAKMLSQYAINVLGKTPADVEVPTFTDVSADLDVEYANGVSLAYKLGIMGINMPNNEFLPYETVTRAQFGTALSRLLFGIEDGEDAYYTTHLAKLKEAGIITNDDPTLEELRGYVMLMLMRSAKSDNNVATPAQSAVSNEPTNKPVNENTNESANEPEKQQEVENYFSEAYKKGQIYGRIGDLQKMLKSLGYYNGDINNTFDNNTIDAVFDFQIAMGILAADDTSSARGYLGPSTRSALNQKWAEFK